MEMYMCVCLCMDGSVGSEKGGKGGKGDEDEGCIPFFFP